MQIASSGPVSYTWDAVFASIANGTYRSKYAIGDLVPLDLGTVGSYNMQIVAFDADELADGTGYAPISWVAAELLATTRRMNAQNNAVEYNTVSAWLESPANTWNAQNKNVDNATASGTWTITASGSGTLTIKYRAENINGGTSKIVSLRVNGTTVAENYTSNTYATYSLEVNIGDVVTISCDYLQSGTALIASSVGSATIIFGGTAMFTVSSTIGTTKTRSQLTYGTGCIGGWEASEMRNYLNGEFYSAIPTDIRSKICAVKKYSRTFTPAAVNNRNYLTSDKIWVPSTRELSGQNNFETSGPRYSEIFPDNNSRIKKKSGTTSAQQYWTRSATAGAWNVITGFQGITTGGGASNSFGFANVSSAYGVLIGFCT